MTSTQSTDITSLTQHLDNILAMVHDMHTKKQNMTRPALQHIENEISKAKNSIINHLLPLIQQPDRSADPTPARNSPSHKQATRSYSDIVRKHTTHSAIVIQDQNSDTTSPDAKSSAPDVINRITEYISHSNHPATIQKTGTTRKDKIIIKFNKTDDVDSIANELRSELGLNARSRKPLLPKMTISHIPSHIDPQDDLLTHIEEYNPLLSDPIKDDQIKILFTYKTKDFSSAVIKVTPHVRSLLIKHQTITIGSRACPVRDRVQSQRCSKCCGFGHSKKHCRETSPTCSFCALEHESFRCPNKDQESMRCCVNCKRSSLNHKHSAFDAQCPLLNKDRKRIINNTDYGSDFPPQL